MGQIRLQQFGDAEIQQLWRAIRRHEDVRGFQIAVNDEVLMRVLDGGADLAIGYFPAVLADLTAAEQAGLGASFEHQRLYAGEYVAVMREGHTLARGPLTLTRFCAARHLLVTFSGRPFGFIDEALASLGERRRVVMTVNQFFTAGQVVARSNLLTVLPRHFVRSTGMAHELVMRELPFDVPTVHVDALWHRRSRLSGAHGWLRDAVARAAQQAFAK